MKIDDLKKQLAEKEVLKTRTELIYQQVLGQISLLREIIAQEEKEQISTPPEEPKKE